MTRPGLLGLVVLVWALAPTPARGQDAQHDDVVVIEAPAVPDTTPTADLDAAVKAIVEATNALRKAEGREPVKVNDKLRDAAKYFAGYMAEKDRYGHTADDTHPADRAKKHGYEYCIVLENIAYAYHSEGFTAAKLAEQFTTGWKESPGHRKNMLNPDATETAVAVARSTKTGHYYAVQMFGRPKSAAIEFKVENKAGAAFEYTLGDKTYSLDPRFTRTHTVCRPPEVTFVWPGDAGKSDPMKPTAGQKLVVTRADDKWAVATE